jgi:hypothetical protein
MKLARLFCFSMIFGSLAIAAHAQTPISISDPGPRSVTPDGCAPGTCINFTYEAGPNTSTSECGTIDVLGVPVGGCAFFIGVESPILITPGTNYGCQVSGSAAAAGAPANPITEIPIFCSPDITDPNHNSYFNGVWLYVPGAFSGETFGESVFGNIPFTFEPISTWGCQEGETCFNPDGTWTVDPTPEPTTALLFMTGLLLFSLGGFVRRRLGANFPS